jgi:hypothetical protein
MKMGIWNGTEASLILNLGARGRWSLDVKPHPLYLTDQIVLPFGYSAGLVGTFRRREFFPIPLFEPRNIHPMNYLLPRSPVPYTSRNRSQMTGLPGSVWVHYLPATETVPLLCVLYIATLSSLLFRQKSSTIGKHSALQDSASPFHRRQQADLCDDSQAAGSLSLWTWELLGPENFLTRWQNNITAPFGDTHGVMQYISAACDHRKK